MSHDVQLLGISNAIVDVLAHVALRPARRTGEDNTRRLERRFERSSSVEVCTSDGANYYSYVLHHARHLLVTEDSINMISEACATRAIVQILRHGHFFGPYLRRFVRDVLDGGYASEYRGSLAREKGPRLDEVDAIAAEVAARIQRHRTRRH